jgi:hypothetical protein
MGHAWRAFGLAVLLVLATQPLYLGALIFTDTIAPAQRRAQVMAPSMQLLANTTGVTTVECTALAIGMEPDRGAVYNAIFAARPLGKTACDGLRAVVENRQDIQWSPYLRYWHGYRVVLDPLTALLRINDSRYVILVMLIAGLAWFGLEIKKLAGDRVAVVLLAPTLLLTDIWRMFQITSHALATAFIFAGAALMARRARTGSSLIVTAALLGSIFNFIDFLTNPPWQPMLLAFVILLSGRGLLLAIQAGLAWGVGYALTWASKWALAVASGGSWKDIAEVIAFRLNGDSAADGVSHYLLAPSMKVLPFLFREIVWQTPLLVILTILFPLLLPLRRPQWRTMAVLSLPALVPFFWFEILSNHTQIYPVFVFRPVASSVGIVLAAWLASTHHPPSTGKRGPIGYAEDVTVTRRLPDWLALIFLLLAIVATVVVTGMCAFWIGLI